MLFNFYCSTEFKSHLFIIFSHSNQHPTDTMYTQSFKQKLNVSLLVSVNVNTLLYTTPFLPPHSQRHDSTVQTVQPQQPEAHAASWILLPPAPPLVEPESRWERFAALMCFVAWRRTGEHVGAWRWEPYKKWPEIDG